VEQGIAKVCGGGRVKLNKSGGQMFPNHYTTNPLAGVCSHNCFAYCYVDDLKERFPNMRKKYSGPVRLDEKVLKGNTGKGKMIFVCSCTDLFAKNVPSSMIKTIINECARYQDNTYLFLSKNPGRMRSFINMMPRNSILATTIETNRQDIIDKCSHAPTIAERVKGMKSLRGVRTFQDFETSISLEPLMNFDLEQLVAIVKEINPTFISIGADSMKNNLVEPSPNEVYELINRIKEITEVRKKNNLERWGFKGDDW